MYVQSVYNYIHVKCLFDGRAFDTIRRYFEYRGYEVAYTSNFYVDDKISTVPRKKVSRPGGCGTSTSLSFVRIALGVKLQTSPSVQQSLWLTSFVLSLTWLKRLYLRESRRCLLPRGKSHNYAKLANKNLKDLELRFQVVPMKKRLARKILQTLPLESCKTRRDFLGQSLGTWSGHIECSVMSTEILGDTIDIHGGGAGVSSPYQRNCPVRGSKTGKTLLTTGCIMAWLISTMSRCLSPWALYNRTSMPFKTLDG